MLIKISGPTFGFGTTPPIGTAVERHSQLFEVVARKPHIDRAGKPTAVLSWQSRCAKCGEPFIQTSGLTGIRSFNVRCPEHHDPLNPASDAAARRKRAASMARKRRAGK